MAAVRLQVEVQGPIGLQLPGLIAGDRFHGALIVLMGNVEEVRSPCWLNIPRQLQQQAGQHRSC
eukprot:8035237-Heterocapsa_arctica.AAC.1